MAVFRAFKPEAMNKIAQSMGYSGDMREFESFIEQDPAPKARMNQFTNAAMQMARGGVVKLQAGGDLQKQIADAQKQVEARRSINYKGNRINIEGGPSMTESDKGNQYQGFYDSGGRFRKFRHHPDLVAADKAYRSATSNLANLQKQYADMQKQAATVVPPTGTPSQPQQPKKPDLSSIAPDTNPDRPFTGQPPATMSLTDALNDPRSTGLEQMLPLDYYLPGAYPPGATPEINPKYRETPDPVGFGTPQPPSFSKGKTDGPVLSKGPEFYTPQQGETLLRNTPTPTMAYTTVMPRTGGEYAFKADGTRVTVPQGYFDQAQQAPAPVMPNPTMPDSPAPPTGVPGTAAPGTTGIGQETLRRMFQPALPTGGVTTAAVTPSEAGQYIDPTTGQLTGQVAVPTAMGTTAQATPQQETQANVMNAAQAAPAIQQALSTVQAAVINPADPRAQVTAAQQTASSVGSLTEAQGNATLINNPVQRNIQAGELISGAAADAQTAAAFTEQVQAATASPSTQATVQGQLAQLTANFDASNPPAWAAGALRGVQAQMAQRGLGASSIAGQAMVQAAMEAALPIASADAQVQAQFEAQNLSNRQARAMLAAQQRATFMGQEFDQAFQARVQNASRISDIANMNFTAEQQIQLENSRATNTMNLNNLSNRQAMTMAEASALAQMDASNLNNRQQAAVNNAQSFLQMDMANLSNQQQTELFKAQQRTQSMFTDQAATNAAAQFNATSQNQVDQFFSNLANQTSQFNATQSNAQSQFNAGQANTVNRFNAEMNNQRDQFNAQNQTVLAQSNAQWRRQIATADTAAINRANEINAQAILGMSDAAYNNLWGYYSDTMEWAWTTAENEQDRQMNIAVATINADADTDAEKIKGDYAASAGLGKFAMDMVKFGITGGF